LILILIYNHKQPEEAKINIRNIPSKDGEIIGVIDSKSLLKSSGQNVGPYYCLELTDGRKGYALSETQDRKLLVSSKSPLKSSGFETQIKNRLVLINRLSQKRMQEELTESYLKYPKRTKRICTQARIYDFEGQS